MSSVSSTRSTPVQARSASASQRPPGGNLLSVHRPVALAVEGSPGYSPRRSGTEDSIDATPTNADLYLPPLLKVAFSIGFVAYSVLVLQGMHKRFGTSSTKWHGPVTSFVFVLVWLGVKYCNSQRGRVLQDILIGIILCYSGASIAAFTESIFHLVIVMLLPLCVQPTHMGTAVIISALFYVVIAAVYATGVVFAVDDSMFTEGVLHGGSPHFLFMASALVPLGVILGVYGMMYALMQKVENLQETLLAISSGRDLTSAGAMTLDSQVVNPQLSAGEHILGASSIPGLDNPNPLVVDVHNLEAENGYDAQNDVEVMSYHDNVDVASPTNSQTLSPITLSPLPTPKNYNDVKVATGERLSSKDSNGSRSTSTTGFGIGKNDSYTPKAYTPTKGRRSLSSRGSITVAPAFRQVTVLCLALRRKDTKVYTGNDSRIVFEDFFNLVAQEAVVDRGGHILPHIDSDVIFVSWGVYSLHENPCFASASCAISLHRRMADRGMLIHGSVIHGRVQCGTFSNPASATPAHFRIIGSAARDAFALLDVAIDIGTACVVDETVVLRIGDYYTSRPVDTFAALGGASSLTGSGNKDAIKVAHEVLMPLFAPGSGISVAMTEWHLIHEKREQMTKHFEKFLAAYEAYAAGRLQVAELLVKVYSDEVPNDRAALRLMAKVNDKLLHQK